MDIEVIALELKFVLKFQKQLRQRNCPEFERKLTLRCSIQLISGIISLLINKLLAVSPVAPL